MRAHLLVCAWLLTWLAAAPAAAAETGPGACHEYEGDAVSLQGTIRLETFPGPPDFLSIHRGDRAVYELVLELDDPVCVKSYPDREEGPLPALASVLKVQALMPLDLPIEAELLGRLGEPVWLHGKLIPPGSHYHFLPLLIQARRMTPVFFKRPEAPEMPNLPSVPGVAVEN